MWKAFTTLAVCALVAPALVSAQQCTTLATASKPLILGAALKATNLLPMFEGNETAYTVFAPTDAAFLELAEMANLTLTSLATLPKADLDGIAYILGSHVVAGSYPAASLTDGMKLPTLSGATITVSIGASVTVSVTATSNATVTTPDAVPNLCAGSVVHVIDKVLIPCTPLSAAAVTNLPSLAAALTATDLVSVFADSDNATAYTVFGPSDEAFAAALKSLNVSLTSLDDSTKATLATILKSHVVAGTYPASSLTDKMVLPTLSGANLTVSIMDGTVMVALSPTSNATVVEADLDEGTLCGGSVLHKISAVLLPPAGTGTTPPPNATAPPPPSTTSGAFTVSYTASLLAAVAGLFAMFV